MSRRRLLVITIIAMYVFVLIGCADDDDDGPSGSSDPGDDDVSNDDDDNDTASDDDDTAPPDFKAGFSMVDISPDHEVKLAGYGSFFIFEAACRWSEGIHDPIYVHAAAFEDGGGDGVILLVFDTVGIITNEIKEIQKGIADATGLPEKSIIVAATHAHHGPDTIGMWGLLIPPRSGRDEGYLDDMVSKAVGAGAQAWEKRVPARLEFAQGQHPDYHFNQNTGDPARALDSTMTVLAAYDEYGNTLGSLMNWAAHPTVMGHRNRLISSDYPGVYYRLMDRQHGGVNMFINGTIAATQPYDPNNDGLFEGDSWEDVELVGASLADKATELLEQGTPITETDIWLLETSEVHALVENFLFWLAAVFDVIPREVPPVGEYGTTYMSTFALGPVTFGTVPGEYIPDYSFRIRNVMGGRAQFIIGMGMDWIGYAVTPAQYSNIDYIYEWFLCPSRWAGEELMAVYEDIWGQAE